MKLTGLRNAIWRSRAVAITGFLTFLLAILPGLPSPLKNTLFAVFGILELSFGFAGSRHKSYAEPEAEAAVSVAVIEEGPVAETVAIIEAGSEATK